MAQNTTSQLLGQASHFLDAVEQAGRAAAVDRPVLVVGERGTGKELIAERIHRLSPRWSGPLIVINCAALPETLIEAELFGHEAGAFTGATRARAGRFEEADGGTLFLDELGTLSIGAQERLLRAVEYGEVTRIGSSRPVTVDVRLVGATNVHLPDAVEEGRFRADLLDRLAFDVVNLPPLRLRDGDVPLLADHFGRRMASECGWDRWPGFADDAMATLEAYGWPGNVRELRNVVERAVYRWPAPERPVRDVPLDPFACAWRQQTRAGEGASSIAGTQAPSSPAPPAVPSVPADITNLRATVDAYEAAIIRHALERHRYNRRAAARALGLTYDQMRHCLRKHLIAAD